MPRHVLDTSYVITNKALITDAEVISDVVLLELIQSAKSQAAVKANKLLREQAASDGTLLEVEPRDWIIAAETIYRMENEVSKGKYQILKKASGATQRMALDTLLAVSAKRSNVIVVTENYKDFEIIRRSLHGLQIMRASDYIDG